MKRNRSFIESHLLCFIFLFLLLPSSALGQPAAYGKFAFDLIHGERGTLIRYGNWYGPGWWGGSEDPNRVGMLPPVDALDKIAQKHDFGYQLAEEIGGSHPEIVAYYKALADAIAVKDAEKLSTNPALWSPPAKDVALAHRYHQRIAVGFRDLVKNFNALLAAFPKKLYGVDEQEMNIILNGRVSPADFEARALRLVAKWDSNFRRAQADKAGKLKPIVPTKKVDPQVNATTYWVLSSTRVWSDNPGMEAAKRQYQESPAGVVGKVSPGLSVHSWVNPNRPGSPKTVLSVTWNAPSPELRPGGEIVVTANAADAGCSSNAGEGDFVGFNMNLFGSHDGKAWELVSSGGRDFYANPFKKDTRIFKLPVPNTAYMQLLLKVESGNQFTGNEAVGYFYDFTSIKPSAPSVGTIEAGVLNKKALILPQPDYPSAAKKIGFAGPVTVNIVVDENGKVISAETDAHPLLRDAVITAARNARFSPPTLSGKPARLSGVLNYVIKPPE